MIFQVFSSNRIMDLKVDPEEIVKSLLKQLAEFYLQEGYADVYNEKLIKYYTLSETDDKTGKTKQYLFLEGEKIDNVEGLQALAELIENTNKRRQILRNYYPNSQKIYEEFGFEVFRIFYKLVVDYRDKYFSDAFLKTTHIGLNQIEDGIFISDKVCVIRKGEKIFRIHGIKLNEKGIVELKNELMKSIEILFKTFQDKMAKSKQPLSFGFDLLYPFETSRDCEIHILTAISKNGIKMPLMGFQVIKKEKEKD